MRKFIWDLDLNQIPLGWQPEYEKALQHYPKGKSVTVEDWDDEPKDYWFDPVACKAMLLDEFNKNRQIATSLCNNVSRENFHSATVELLRIEILLYSIISAWIESDDDEGDSLQFYDEQALLSYLHAIEASEHFKNDSSNMTAYQQYKFFKDLCSNL